MARFYLTQVFILVTFLCGTFAQAPGKDPCQGTIPLYGACDMGYWSGRCDYAWDKQGVTGHEICVSWCDISAVSLPAGVELVPTSVTGAYTGVSLDVTCAAGTSPAPGTVLSIICINGTFGDFCGQCLSGCGVLDPTTIDANANILATSGNIDGDVAVLGCNAPYVATGSLGAECVDGTWEPRGNGECVMPCPNLPGISFTNMHLATTVAGVDFTAGDILEFECNADSVANGCNYAVCLDTGIWDVTDNGGCLPTCPNPPGITFNNMVLTTPTEGEEFSDGDMLHFECIADYFQTGCNYAECLANGSWAVYDSNGCSSGASVCNMRYYTAFKFNRSNPSFAKFCSYYSICTLSRVPGYVTTHRSSLLFTLCYADWIVGKGIVSSGTKRDILCNCQYPPLPWEVVDGAVAGPDVTGDIATYTCDSTNSVNDEAIFECTSSGWVVQQSCGSVYGLCSADLSALLPSDLNKCRYYNGKCYCPKESELTYTDGKAFCDGLSVIPGVDATMVIVDDYLEYLWLWLYGYEVIYGNEIWWLPIRTDGSGTPYDDYNPFDLPPYMGHLTSAPYGTDLCGYFETDSAGSVDDAWGFDLCNRQNKKKKTICEIDDPYQ